MIGLCGIVEWKQTNTKWYQPAQNSFRPILRKSCPLQENPSFSPRRKGPSFVEHVQDFAYFCKALVLGSVHTAIMQIDACNNPAGADAYKVEVFETDMPSVKFEGGIDTHAPGIWILLCLSVVGVSCAGTMFQQIDEIPPILRASWRLQATSLLLLPCAMVQWCQSSLGIKQRCLEKRTLYIMCISGVSVAAHFGCWVASLDMTTLTHSLLFVSMHPIVVATGMYVLANLPSNTRSYIQSWGVHEIRAPTRLEQFGVAIGVVGACITLLDVGSEQGRHIATIGGDVVAFMGAMSFISYQVCGRILREWMPIFLYAFPVTFLGSLLLIPVSFLAEAEAAEFMCGWASVKYIYWFIALSLIAGILGHTGFNMCLSYMSPLLVCSAVQLEPAIGSLAGYLAFDSGLPGTWTTVGGAILILSVFSVSFGANQDMEKQQNELVKQCEVESHFEEVEKEGNL